MRRLRGVEVIRGDRARRSRAASPRHRGADLVLTGGETARRTLDALGVTTLEPIAQIHHGAVQCRTPDGRHVVIRPGSFGGPDSLVQIVAACRIAVTMGDGAGIGPEIVVAALSRRPTSRRS